MAQGKKRESGPKLPLYPKWNGAERAEGDCPRCGQADFNTRIHAQGFCVLCAIDAGKIDVPPDLQAKGWRLIRSCYHCVSAVCHDLRLSTPLFASFQIDACVAMAQGYAFAWEWLHEGGAGYQWGWRLEEEFHITYRAIHETLGRIPRSRHDAIWLSELPERIIVDLVVEALQSQHERRKVAVAFGKYVATRQLAERARAGAAIFAAIPDAAFEQKELL